VVNLASSPKLSIQPLGVTIRSFTYVISGGSW
jgi:hypothetical protein